MSPRGLNAQSICIFRRPLLLTTAIASTWRRSTSQVANQFMWRPRRLLAVRRGAYIGLSGRHAYDCQDQVDKLARWEMSAPNPILESALGL